MAGLLAGWTSGTAPTGSWRPAEPGYPWEFPRDYGRHPDYKTEWWYVTGHLFPEDAADPSDGALAFQMTFFRVGLVPHGQPLPDFRLGRHAIW